MSGPLTDELVDFILEVCDSVEVVEMLLVLAGAPETTFTSEEMARRLATSIESARLRLEHLARSALVTSTDHRYRFAPATAKRARMVAELGAAYRTHRMRVIDVVFGGRDPAAEPQKSN